MTRHLRWLAAWLLLACVLIIASVALPPAVFIFGVWLRDSPTPLPATSPGMNDAGRLATSQPAEVVAADTESQLAALVVRAAREGRHISISGARHSMGGHTLYPGGIALDMLPFDHMSLDAAHGILTVGAGARWSEVIPFLDERGFAVKVMQSNADFSVGGSLSVNCHGWQPHSPPIASTVESFRLLRADGTIVRCSPTENPYLFRAALGGYGLFGVILDANLRVVPNELYQARSFVVRPEDYARKYKELLDAYGDKIGMAYGRISVAPSSFLDDAAITLLLRKDDAGKPPTKTLPGPAQDTLLRLIFRGSVNNNYGKNLRWALEKAVGGTADIVLSRNQIMIEPAEWFSNRDADATEILHEYFIPPRHLTKFVADIKPILLRHHAELLNITVRNVEADTITLLPYAREEVFGLVMLFHQGRDAASEAAMQSLTADMIDAALSCEGTYYLPYRLHASLAQFTTAYPSAPEFFRLKNALDPAGTFANQFYLKYGSPPP